MSRALPERRRFPLYGVSACSMGSHPRSGLGSDRVCTCLVVGTSYILPINSPALLHVEYKILDRLPGVRVFGNWYDTLWVPQPFGFKLTVLAHPGVLASMSTRGGYALPDRAEIERCMYEWGLPQEEWAHSHAHRHYQQLVHETYFAQACRQLLASAVYASAARHALACARWRAHASASRKRARCPACRLCVSQGACTGVQLRVQAYAILQQRDANALGALRAACAHHGASARAFTYMSRRM